MVETRARARLNASHSANRSGANATAKANETPQIDALFRELDADATKLKRKRGVIEKVQDKWNVILQLSGATLLTRGERILYGLAILIMLVLVLMGVSHAADFYGRVLARSVLGPN